MSKKLEKLREVNATLTERLKELETKMFIENIHVAKEVVVKEQTPRITMELK